MAYVQMSNEELLQRNAELQDDLNTSIALVAKLRSENDTFKINFQTLKNAHQQLQEQNRDLKARLQGASAQMEATRERHESLVSQWKVQLDAKAREFDELRQQVLSPKDVEMFKVKVLEEVEGPHRQKYEALERDYNHYRSAFFTLRRDMELLKQDRQQLEAEHGAVVEELRGQYAAEVSEVKRRAVADESVRRTPKEAGEEMIRHRLCARENKELTLQTKELLSENEDLRQRLETAEVAAEQAARLNSRSLTESKSLCLQLESERDALSSRAHKLQEALDTARRQHQDLQQQLADSTRDAARKASRLEEAEHRASIVAGDLRIELAEARAKWEAERGALAAEAEEARAVADDLRASVAEMGESVSSKEREVERRVQIAREEERAHLRAKEEEIVEVQAQLDERQRAGRVEAEERRQELQGLREQLTGAEDARRTLERDLQMVNSSNAQHVSKIESLELEMQRFDALAKSHRELKARFEELAVREQSGVKAAQELEATIDQLRNQITDLKQYAEREQHAYAQNAERSKQLWGAERRQLQDKVAALAADLDTVYHKYKELYAHCKSQKAKHAKRAKRQQRQVHSLAVQLERLGHEKSTACAAAEAAQRESRQKLEALERRHAEFRHVIEVEEAANVTVQDVGLLGDLSAMHHYVDHVQLGQQSAFSHTAPSATLAH